MFVYVCLLELNLTLSKSVTCDGFFTGQVFKDKETAIQKAQAAGFSVAPSFDDRETVFTKVDPAMNRCAPITVFLTFREEKVEDTNGALR